MSSRLRTAVLAALLAAGSACAGEAKAGAKAKAKAIYQFKDAPRTGSHMWPDDKPAVCAGQPCGQAFLPLATLAEGSVVYVRALSGLS